MVVKNSLLKGWEESKREDVAVQKRLKGQIRALAERSSSDRRL